MTAVNELLQLREALLASLGVKPPGLSYLRAPIARDETAVRAELARAPTFAHLPAAHEAIVKAHGCPAAMFRRPRVLIVRRRGRRELLNYHSLLKAVRGMGADVTIFDDHSLPKHRDILRAFTSMDAVVAVHGAGLTNVFVSQPGAAVFEVLASNFAGLHYAEYSIVMGLEYFRWEVEPVWPAGVNAKGFMADKLANVMAPLADMSRSMCGFFRRRLGTTAAAWKAAHDGSN